MHGRHGSILERKGPHKSMHCKFCKPPGVVTPEKPTRPQLETKTKLHLVHEAADLRVCNIHNEPGIPPVEQEGCVCVLEGENSCPKCVPDKSRPPPKKKVCRCPKGAKQHPSMCTETTPTKKKPVEEDDEFWWEKYSREHDAQAKETWAAYMAQRKKDKKFEKFQKHEKQALIAKKSKGTPGWFQKLSCQQMIYVEYLSTAIRLDSDENVTDRTFFVMAGLGMFPRPKRTVLKKCLRYCHYNSVQFLNQLHLLIKEDDPFEEKLGQKEENAFTWNERLIMNSMCHLEFPALLRELMDRLPPLPRKSMLPQIPYPVFPQLPKKKYDSPYEEPLWQDRLNWVEKSKIDRLNRCRMYMETKRVKIPPLALVRRPSLIDARPPFLAQIEANELAARRLAKGRTGRRYRRRPVSTFNSAVDMTAIAGIEASEISTTDKADTEDICVFLRDPKESEGGEVEEEESEVSAVKDFRFAEDTSKTKTQVDRVSPCLGISEEDSEGEDIPFKTPPKTKSGATIASPCRPPDATPGPPARHFDIAKRELDIVNEEICGFFPFVSSSTQTVKEEISNTSKDVRSNLKQAAQKLKKFADAGGKRRKKGAKKSKKKDKRKRKNKRKPKTRSSYPTVEPVEEDDPVVEVVQPGEEDGNEEDFAPETIDDDINDISISFQVREKPTPESQIQSEVVSDPDLEDTWSTQPPCTPKLSEEERKAIHDKWVQRRAKLRRRRRRRRRRRTNPNAVELREETGVYEKRRSQTGSEPSASNTREEEKTVEVFEGEVEPLVEDIINDLAEEGFHCASYPLLMKHPDISQLILYLRGEILNKKLRKTLLTITKAKWSQMKGLKKFPISELGISAQKAETADWNDKNWISRLAKKKKDKFYYKVADVRADYGVQIFNTLYQEYFGTERYLKIFCAYMTSKYEDAILRGLV